MTARATSYEGTESRGELMINWLPPRERIQGRHVLLVEDIVDTGATVATLVQKIEDLGAASVRVCALLNKPSRRKYDVEVAYVGLDIPNVFVVGYGLDYNGHFRNLPDVRGTGRVVWDPPPSDELSRRACPKEVGRSR